MARAKAQCFKTVGGMLSIPLALWGSRLFKASRTSCTVKWIESKHLPGTGRFKVSGRLKLL